MDEYIKRDPLVEICENQGHVDIDDILSVPASDVAPVVLARWKFFHKKNKAVCTNCSYERDLDWDFGHAVACPNCGAIMDT